MLAMLGVIIAVNASKREGKEEKKEATEKAPQKIEKTKVENREQAGGVPPVPLPTPNTPTAASNSHPQIINANPSI